MKKRYERYKKMRDKKGNVLKASVVIAIAMALVLPVAAAVINEVPAIKRSCHCGEGTRTMAEGKTFYMAEANKMVTPTMIGCINEEGTVTDWVEYHQTRQGDLDLVFDSFEPDTNDEQCPDGNDAEPIGGGSCGSGEPEDCSSNRWYFGTDYCNMYVTNDMQFSIEYGGSYVERLEFAWYWYVEGPGSGENMAAVIEVFEDFDDTCELGDPDGSGEFLGGVVLTFGYEDGDPGGYFFTDVDLAGMDWLLLPEDGEGSYNIWLLSYVGDEPQYPDDFSLATCGQPMLWGTGDAESPVIDTINRGQMDSSGPIQWDDDNPISGFHEAFDECYDYSNESFCPNPMGAMLCFYAAGGVCPGDINGDGETSHSDLGILLSVWNKCEGDEGWNPDADLDGSGCIDHPDLGILLADWGCGT